MKKQYLFIFLIGIMLLLLFEIWKFKFHEYQIYKYKIEIEQLNENYREKIELAQQEIEKIHSRAYINKSLKSQEWLKNPGEELITLITEDTYKTYSQNDIKSYNTENNSIYLDPLSQNSIIQSMTPYQKWIYLLFKKDTR